nr:metallophosphoesterase [uncultured Agathobaculum sp.]
MGAKKRIACAFILCAAGIGIAGLQCGLTVRYYTIQTEQFKSYTPLRLVMLSDLHSYIYGNDQSPLIQKVKAVRPDIILLCGDIVDDKRPQRGAKLLLERITDIAPCFYVSGNHEFWADDPQEIFSMIESYGIRVLQNEQEVIDWGGEQFTICGVDDPARYGGQRRSYGNAEMYKSVLDGFDDLPENSFHILMAHRPEYIKEYASHPFDLVLCGHAHGGQWRIPYLLNGLVAPNQGFFPSYAGGQYICGSMTQIVGRGLMIDWKPRLFNPTEIVVVDITGI